MKGHVNQNFPHDDDYIEDQLNSWWQEEIGQSKPPWENKWLQGKAKRQQKCNEERLQEYDLPNCNSLKQIARAMGITPEELRLLAFSPNADAATKHHYIHFNITKKTGGKRTISAPTQRLKRIQYWIFNQILKKLEPTIDEAAHGFRSSRVIKYTEKQRTDLELPQYSNQNQISVWRKILNQIQTLAYTFVHLFHYFDRGYGKRRSIVTNAEPHIGADVIINFDLKDFFPSISYRRVKGLFKSFGYSESAATIFGLLCTVTFTNNRSYLPQGAPTSPIITNLICRRLDRRLTNLATDLGFCYTRYADDLTFSASGDSLCNISKILRKTERIVTQEGFKINKEKTRILRKSRRQEVTGIVVNNKLNISREKLRRFRATLYQIEKDGLDGKYWGKSQDIVASIQGFANFVAMVNPEKGAKFQEQIRRIKDKYGY